MLVDFLAIPSTVQDCEEGDLEKELRAEEMTPVFNKKVTVPPATPMSTPGPSPVMVTCSGRAGWNGPLQYYATVCKIAMDWGPSVLWLEDREPPLACLLALIAWCPRWLIMIWTFLSPVPYLLAHVIFGVLWGGPAGGCGGQL